MLDESLDTVAVCSKFANQGFGVGIARQRDRPIGISGKPRFGARRNSQAADQCEGDLRFSEIGVDLAWRSAASSEITPV